MKNQCPRVLAIAGLLVGSLASCALRSSATEPVAPEPGATDREHVVRVAAEGGKIAITIGGEPFAEYRFTDTPKPFLYPLVGPDGVRMTRSFPMEEAPGEAKDHPHHRSAWFAHGDVNGHDFWHGGETNARIVHQDVVEVTGTDRTVVTRSRSRWIAGEDELVCTEERVMSFSGDDDARRIDFEITLTPAGAPLRFGDTKEGTMALRLHPALRLRGPVAKGSCLNSAGDQGKECWGKRAAWVDYWGPVDGKEVGAALFDHPSNPRHPTWWHARDYGLFAANPFGVHDFEGKPAGTGDLVVPAGESVTFRYRLLLHRGPADAAALDRELARYSED